MKFAKKAAKSAGADLDVIFHFTSTGMSELTECPGSCHPQFLTKLQQQGSSCWQLGGGSPAGVGEFPRQHSQLHSEAPLGIWRAESEWAALK